MRVIFPNANGTKPIFDDTRNSNLHLTNLYLTKSSI